MWIKIKLNKIIKRKNIFIIFQFIFISYVLFLYQPIDSQTTNNKGKPDKRVELSNLKLNQFSCLGGLTLCPDRGEFKRGGGNTTLTIMEMRNLPNLDGFGLAGLYSDPYIIAKIGNNSRKSSMIRNSLNPIWEPCKSKGCKNDKIKRDLNFGYRFSGTPIIISVYDKDDGLEFQDDLINEVSINVIYCSSFSSYMQSTPNEEDSLWKMPKQPLCEEEAWISLDPKGISCIEYNNINNTFSISKKIPCMKLKMTVIPFQIRIEEIFVKTKLNDNGLIPVSVNGGMAGYYDENYAREYGRVYSGSDDRLMNYYRFTEAKGGILVRLDSKTNNEKGNKTLLNQYPFVPYVRFTMNYDANLYVFRRESDWNSDNIPEWLDNKKYNWIWTREYAQLVGGGSENFRAVMKSYKGHTINRYGDAFGAGITIGMNTRQDYNDTTSQMYFVVLVPHESFDSLPIIYTKDFSRMSFYLSFLQFGIVFILFISMVIYYWKQVNWRLDRVESYLLRTTQFINEKEDHTTTSNILNNTFQRKNLISTLFECYNDSEFNIEFRRNLFYAKLAMNLCIMIPFFILITWGITIITTVKPPAFGFGLIFIGIATIFILYSMIRWSTMGWRMTPTILTLLGIGFLLCFLFLFSSIFVDPKVYYSENNEKIDFYSLTCIFMTMNMILMIWLNFTNDKKIMKSLKNLIAAVTVNKKVDALKKKFKNLGSLGIKLATAKGTIQRDRGEKQTSAFYSLMGEYYSIVSSIPGFSLADILNNVFIPSSSSIVSTNTNTNTNTNKKSNYILNRNHYCYIFSIFILIIYSFIGFFYTNYPLQGIGIIFTVILLDSSVFMLCRGKINWSAVYLTILMITCRASLVLTSGKYWLLGQCLLFMIYGTALCKEIVGKNLPGMSKQEAIGITFFSYDIDRKPDYDISTSPEFSLGFISFFYILLLLGVAFGSNTEEKLEHIIILFEQEWPLWIFGVLSFILVLFVGIILGASRAFLLMKEHLLSDFATEAFLLHTNIKLPIILASASEILVICSGLFIYASTGSRFILELSIFGPIILILFILVYSQWKKNDYRLVIWPPEDKNDENNKTDDLYDEEAEFEKEAEALREAFIIPPLQTTPNTIGMNEDTNDISFKMPSLPIKGTLIKSSIINKNNNKPSILQISNNLKVNDDGTEEDETKIDKEKDKEIRFDKELNNKNQDITDQISEKNNDLNTSIGKENNNNISNINMFQLLKKEIMRLFKPWEKYQKVTDDNLIKNKLKLGIKKKSSKDIEKGMDLNISMYDNKENEIKTNNIPSRFEDMSLYYAFRYGYLLQEDYITIISFILLFFFVFLFGLIVSITEKPVWLGHIIWLSFYILFLSISPIIKYYNTLEVTNDMKICTFVSIFLSWISGIIIFVIVLNASVNDIESLFILSFLIFYPILLIFIITILIWKDQNWMITKKIKYILQFCFGSSILFNFEIYIWISPSFGGIITFLLLLFLIILFFLFKWIENQYYLPPYYQRKANQIMIGSALFFSLFLGIVIGVDIFYSFSIAFIIIIIKSGINIIGIRLTREPEMQILYSPYIFPIFSFDGKTNNINDESLEVKNIFYIYILLFFWGIFAIFFVDPLGIGISLCCLSLLSIFITCSYLCCLTPIQIGIASKYVNDLMLKEAADSVKRTFDNRRKNFISFECKEYYEKDEKDKEMEIEYQRVSLGITRAQVIEKMNLKNEGISDIQPIIKEDERKCAADIALLIDDNIWKCNYSMLEQNDHENDLNKLKIIETRRPDALLNYKDIVIDIIRGGKGPFGYISLFGYPFLIYHKYIKPYITEKLKKKNKKKKKKSKGLDKYNNDGTIKNLFITKSSIYNELTGKEEIQDINNIDLVDSIQYLKDLPDLDKKLDYEFYEETRCIIHFQLLLLNAADARIAREIILFQKFLRENRFKLMSNGINPPLDIFKTTSFASIDIPLVATWILSLTNDEKERFRNLKTNFSQEMIRKDAFIDAEDEQNLINQKDWYENTIKIREEYMCTKRYQEFQARRLRRQEENIMVPKEKDEAIINIEESLAEIDSGWACYPGEYGRLLQFVDPDFPPDEVSIEGCRKSNEIVEWKVASGININTCLFSGGTDPDDVYQGKLNNGWFLSAISIIAASGGVDDGQVDPLISNLFITKDTSINGAYAIRFYKNSQWESIIVDDYFPILDSTYKSDKCNGAAFAHSKNFQELWVPLLEKAYAKYHGGYSVLEAGGYVHHALKDLTGCESEEIYLAQASRGSRKKQLWKKLIEYKKNNFLMGAGSITSDHADHEILDTGLVFGACYVIYEVIEIDNYHLIKLRNPPGDHAEWKGDWSDESDLWTKRLKKKLKWTIENDNTFWMSFDDFCNAFRCLYVCRYYDPNHWPIITYYGTWMNETSGGLPCKKHNPECQIDINTQYTLNIKRPTDIVIKVTQVDENGLANMDIQPFAVYIVKSVTVDRGTRIKKLSKDNIIISSGNPIRKRNIEILCTLQPQMYIILIAPYIKGMTGSFKLTVQSNFSSDVEQLWPPPWKEPSESNTIKEKMTLKIKEKLNDNDMINKLKGATNMYTNKIASGVAAFDNGNEN